MGFKFSNSLVIFGVTIKTTKKSFLENNNGISYKFDLWNPKISCDGEEDLVHSDGKIGFLEVLDQGNKRICRKFEELKDYKITKTKGGHDLTFTSRNACTDQHYPKDLTTIFRLTCDYNSPSRAPFMVMKTKTSWTKIFEVVSEDACDLFYAGRLNFNLGSHSYTSLKYLLIVVVVLVSTIYLTMFCLRRKYNNEKKKYRAMKQFA